MSRSHVPDPLVTDPHAEIMRGVFPTVSVSEEVELRAVGYIPVLRWVKVQPDGGLSPIARTTREALRTVRQQAVRRRATRKARRA